MKYLAKLQLVTNNVGFILVSYHLHVSFPLPHRVARYTKKKL